MNHTQGYFAQKNAIYAIQMTTDGVLDTTYWGMQIYEKGDYVCRQGGDNWVCKKHIFEKAFTFIADDVKTVYAHGYTTLSDLLPDEADQAKISSRI